MFSVLVTVSVQKVRMIYFFHPLRDLMRLSHFHTPCDYSIKFDSYYKLTRLSLDSSAYLQSTKEFLNFYAISLTAKHLTFLFQM